MNHSERDRLARELREAEKRHYLASIRLINVMNDETASAHTTGAAFFELQQATRNLTRTKAVICIAGQITNQEDQDAGKTDSQGNTTR